MLVSRLSSGLAVRLFSLDIADGVKRGVGFGLSERPFSCWISEIRDDLSCLHLSFSSRSADDCSLLLAAHD